QPGSFQTTTSMPVNNSWRVNQSFTTEPGSTWRSPDPLVYDDSVAPWTSGTGVLANSAAVLALPPGVQRSNVLNTGKKTYYLRTHFQFNGDPSSIELQLRPLFDDAFVAYLNGFEVLRKNFAVGTNVTYDTIPSASVGDAS